MRKFISILLAVMLVASLVVNASAASAFRLVAVGNDDPVAPAEATYVVAGNAEGESEKPDTLFNAFWDPSYEGNTMTLGEDGKYSKTFTAEKAYESVSLKVVKKTEEGSEWIGDANNDNVQFAVTAAGDFIVAIDPETNAITVTGDNVAFATNFEFATITAVGNSVNTGFLNNKDWAVDAAENHMTKGEGDVWTITYPEVSVDNGMQVKFAFDDSWSRNFGGPSEDAPVIENGKTYDAVWDGGNIALPFTGEEKEDECAMTLTLDLTNFDFATKTGATFTISWDPDIVPAIEEPATEAPTAEPSPSTEEPTAEPATEAPATEAPATEAPATEAPAPAEATYVVAGNAEGESDKPDTLFNAFWDPSYEGNTMTLGEDGKYSKTFTAEKAYESVSLKVVKKTEKGSEWIGDANNDNVQFAVTAAGDFIVAIDPETNAITVTGDNVAFATSFEFATITAVGNSVNTGFLNNKDWAVDAAENHMTKGEGDVWTITYPEVSVDNGMQVKFAFDDSWSRNFGGPSEDAPVIENGKTYDAVWDGGNIALPFTGEEEEDECAMTLTLDLTNFDFATKTGATFTISWDPDIVPAIEEPATEAPTAEPSPSTEEPTAEPATDEPIVGAAGYYIVGSMTDWGLDQAFMLEANPENRNEYLKKGVALKTNDQFKVVYTADGVRIEDTEWYPAGMGNNYGKNGEITADGTYDVYFNYDGQGGEGWFEGYIFVDGMPEPSTEEPTGEPAPSTEEPIVGEPTYTVAGSVSDIFGEPTWSATNEDNLMTKGDDGKFSKTYTVDKAYDSVQLKVVKKVGTGSEWIGDAAGANVSFELTGAGSFTVAIDPETKEVTVTGDIVKFASGLEVEKVIAVGNASGTTFLNGKSWAVNDDENAMTKGEGDVWTITYPAVSVDTGMQVKFAVNGTWDSNFGCPKEEAPVIESGKTYDAVWDGGNIALPFTGDEEDLYDITLTLDLTNFDFATKTGATYTVEWAVASDEPSTEEPPMPGAPEYYLVGSFTQWETADAYKLAKNAQAEGEYMLQGVELKAEDALKVKSVNGSILGGDPKWYPDGEDNNLVVEADGTYDVYFRPDGQGGEDWFEGYIYLKNTAEPSTEEPTGEPAPSTEEPIVGEPTYTVAGSVSDIFGEPTWSATNEDNLMAKGDDGKFSKTYTVDKAYDSVQLKVVKKVGTGSEWIGDAAGANVSFELTGAGSFTVAIDPDTKEITVTGDIVKFASGLEVEKVIAVGNASGTTFLNGKSWAVNDDENAMTKGEGDVWTITYPAVSVDTGMQVKFAVNGTWDSNFGCPKEEAPVIENGKTYDAVWDGGNIALPFTGDEEDLYDITLTLDLTNFDFATKTGATYMVEWSVFEEPIVGQTDYYVVGSFTDWKIDENYKLTANPEAEGEFMLNGIELKAKDELKIVSYTAGTQDGAMVWYPDGEGNNYVVGEDGSFDIYFRPDGNGGKDWFEGVAYVTPATEAPTLLGDVDGDGHLTIYDASAIQKYLAGMNPRPFYAEVADYDGDEHITIYDVSAIQKALASASGATEAPDPTDAPAPAPTDAPATEAPAPAPTDAPATEPPAPAPTEQPVVGKSFYLVGDITDPFTGKRLSWDTYDQIDGNLKLTEVEKDVLYKFEGITLRAEGDSFKVIKSSKKGDAVANWFPDGMDNNRTVAEDGVYTIWFRPKGDGTEEDGWEYIYTVSDGSSDDLNHGCTTGGYMYKIVKTGEIPA